MLRRILLLPDFHGQNTARGALVLLGFSIHLSLAQTDQVNLIWAYALKKKMNWLLRAGRNQKQQNG